MLKYALLITAAALPALAVASPADAAVVIDGFTLDTGSFGTGFGVHSTGTQSGTTLDGVVNGDGSAVLFSSSDLLSVTGSGQATFLPLSGSITNLEVEFAKAWDNITFSLGGPAGTFSLLVNSTSLFTGPSCDICTIGKGQNKFIISGSGISSLSYNFNPGVDTARQFRVEGVSVTGAIPEPGTWALMLIGFGALGMTMRRRRGSEKRAVRPRLAF